MKKCIYCGKMMDDNGRFCTYCDGDNAPRGNRGSTVQVAPPSAESNTNQGERAPAPKKKEGAGKGFVSAIAIIFVIIYLIVMIFGEADFR